MAKAAALAVCLSLGLSAAAEGPSFAASSGSPAAAARARPAPDSLLSDTLNRWPGGSAPVPAQPPGNGSARPGPAGPAASRPPAAPVAGADPARASGNGPAAASPSPSDTSGPRNAADTLARRERFLNAITGSHQKAEPLRWRERAPYPGAPLLLSLPAADLPFSLKGGVASPSMRQSLLANAAFTQWADQSLAWIWSGAESGFLRVLGTYASIGFFAWVSEYVPPGDAWMHEEWHRAVFTQDGIASHNGVYHWEFGAEAIAVDQVEDRDLAALKERHPNDFIRLMEAGGEGETEAAREMRRRNFFLGRPSAPDLIAWWSSGVNLAGYIWVSSVPDYDETLRDANAKEADPRQRDFTGFDFRAWVYDLRHPFEPYAAGPRGRVHPSGTGFDRYLMNADLSRDERDFLKVQSGLSLLNLVAGQNFGWDWLTGINPFTGQGYLWNFGLTHHLTPFGYAVGGEFMARQGRANWVFTAQANANASLVLPCLGAQLFRYPLAIGREPVFLSLSASAWMQPQGLHFRDETASPGAYGLLGAAFPVGPDLELFAEGDLKTAGWVPGVVYLGPAAEGRAGVQLRL